MFTDTDQTIEVDGFTLRAATAADDSMGAWCRDDWSWIGVVVTASREGVELGSASLWGIESDAGAYLVDTANNLIAEALADAKARVERISA